MDNTQYEKDEASIDEILNLTHDKIQEMLREYEESVQYLRSSRQELSDTVGIELRDMGYMKYEPVTKIKTEEVYLPKEMQITVAEQIISSRGESVSSPFYFVSEDDIQKARESDKYRRIVRARERSMAKAALMIKRLYDATTEEVSLSEFRRSIKENCEEQIIGSVFESAT